MPLPLALKRGPQDKDMARKREKAFIANAPPKLKLRLKNVYEKMRVKGINARSYRNPVVVDIDAAKPRWMCGISPCLTRTRASTGSICHRRGGG